MSKKRKMSKQVEDATMYGMLLTHRTCLFKDELKRYIECHDKEFFKYRIHRAISNNGFSLSEKALKNIDSEDRLPILKAIYFLFLPLLDDFGEEFLRIRFFLLENKRYWKYIALEIPDDLYLSRSERNARKNGRNEGRRMEKLEMARKLEAEGVGIDIIYRASGLTVEEVEKLTTAKKR
ncbi:MAG: hypothetical protein GY940_30680 [bacterium]|nr:hypothetical protein [bacterium]